MSSLNVLGSSNHTTDEREKYDYYATDPIAAEYLIEEVELENILEPCCGEGHLSKVFIDDGITVTSTDLIDRGYGTGGINFLEHYTKWDGDIVTNPPYMMAQEFVQHSLDIVPDGRKVIMFLKTLFLESKGRRQFFADTPLKEVMVSSGRIKCAKGGDFNSMKSSAVSYSWFIWEKGYEGIPTVKWFN